MSIKVSKASEVSPTHVYLQSSIADDLMSNKSWIDCGVESLEISENQTVPDFVRENCDENDGLIVFDVKDHVTLLDAGSIAESIRAVKKTPCYLLDIITIKIKEEIHMIFVIDNPF